MPAQGCERYRTVDMQNGLPVCETELRLIESEHKHTAIIFTSKRRGGGGGCSGSTYRLQPVSGSGLSQTSISN